MNNMTPAEKERKSSIRKLLSVIIAIIIMALMLTWTISDMTVDMVEITAHAATVHKTPYPTFAIPSSHKYEVTFTGASGKQYSQSSVIPYDEFNSWRISALTGPSIAIKGSTKPTYVYVVASSKKLSKVQGPMYRDIKGASKVKNGSLKKYSEGMKLSDTSMYEYIENDTKSFIKGTWKPRYVYIEVYTGKTSTKTYFDETGIHKKTIYPKSLSKPVDILELEVK